jgi:hypothetical protein
MGPTPPTLWVFRITVAAGLLAVLYFTHASERYFMWAAICALLFAVFALQAFGQVLLRNAGSEKPDYLSRAMNGSHGLWVRAGVLLLFVLLVLLGIGALEPAALVDKLLGFAGAA